MNKIKVLAICGESASGKDTIARIITLKSPKDSLSTLDCLKANFTNIISCTTRPKRDNEVDGEDYHFVSERYFLHCVCQRQMLEYTEFNGWFYGTINNLSPDLINVGVFNPEGIRTLLQNPDLDVCVAFISCPSVIRLKRSLDRESNPNCEEICRRFLADRKDFDCLDFTYDLYVNDGSVPVANVAYTIMQDALKFFGQNEENQLT